MDRLGWWIFAASYLVIYLEDTGSSICNYNVWQWFLLPICTYDLEYVSICLNSIDVVSILVISSFQFNLQLFCYSWSRGVIVLRLQKKTTLRSFPSFEELSIAAKRSVGTEVAIESQGAQYDLRRWRKQKQNAERVSSWQCKGTPPKIHSKSPWTVTRPQKGKFCNHPFVEATFNFGGEPTQMPPSTRK